MKGIIRLLSYIAIIFSVAFFLNYKLKLHISLLEIKTMDNLYVWIGLFAAGLAGLYFTKK